MGSWHQLNCSRKTCSYSVNLGFVTDYFNIRFAICIHCLENVHLIETESIHQLERCFEIVIDKGEPKSSKLKKLKPAERRKLRKNGQRTSTVLPNRMDVLSERFHSTGEFIRFDADGNPFPPNNKGSCPCCQSIGTIRLSISPNDFQCPECGGKLSSQYLE